MTFTDCIHPELLKALAQAGHGSNILIADGNFPADIGVPERAAKVFLNYAPNKPLVPEVLETVTKLVDVESALVAVRDDGKDTPIMDEFRSLLPEGTPLEKVGRWDFRAACMAPETGLLIQTGDLRLYGCILLTVGIRTE